MSKANIIREMFTQGKTVNEISKELSTHYSYVYTVCNKIKKEVQVVQPKITTQFSSMEWTKESYAVEALKSHELSLLLDTYESDEGVPTLQNAIEEAEYVLGTFTEEGHCNCNWMLDFPEEAGKEVQVIKSFIKKYN